MGALPRCRFFIPSKTPDSGFHSSDRPALVDWRTVAGRRRSPPTRTCEPVQGTARARDPCARERLLDLRVWQSI